MWMRTGIAVHPLEWQGRRTVILAQTKSVLHTAFRAGLIVLIAATCALTARAGDKGKDPDQIGNRDVGKGTLANPNFYSVEKEIAIGKQMAQQVERQAKIVDDRIIAEYVNRVGQNLVRNSDAKVPFTIKVIDSEEVNAFALPGGFFFVNTGIITAASNEAEMAGVMAHEIGHVAAHHGMKAQTKGDLINYASIPAMIFLGGWTGYAIRQGAQLAIPMGFLTFSRANEAEADMLGLQYMYKTGYDPNSFVDFFEKVQSLEKRKPGTMSKLFSSHPPTDDRIKATQKHIQEQLKPRPEYVVNTSEFDDVKARVLAMHGRKASDSNDPNKPTLRRNPNGTVDSNGQETTSSPDDGDRPTLKRRD
jgi:predicted Zn-dependent protease